AKVGGSIYWVNFVCACVLMWGTIVFCRRQPNPWLALLAAVPYMLVVVGMGYTRQAGALGFALLGLSALGDGRVRAFVVWIIVGALFHKSAVLLLPIAALANSRNRILTGALVLLTTALTYYLLLADSAEKLWANYVDADLQSEGGLVRVVMNAVPALLLLVFRHRLVPDPGERRLWCWIAVFALACVPLVGLASTAVDRVALYLIPLQLFVFSRMPRLAATTQTRTPVVLGIVAYYAAVQYVWLNYATHAPYWTPYQFMPFGG
ncbi:MAG: EpsG family protein, partial [Pseudomonadota bacterium]|nr:EpsG family protein [Pseudomonadota bacterium]